MTKPPIDLNNVRFFLKTVEGKSFSAAARVFNVPPSMVSRRIARLEREIGTRLFHRTTRSLQLTQAGLTFLRHARTGIEQFQLAQQVLGDLQDTPRGRVRLTAPVGLGDALWEVVATFMGQYPEVRVEMEFIDRFVDLAKEGFDMAIRAGRDDSFAQLIGRRLAQSPRFLLASPQYLKSRGEPKSIADLSKHDCVILGGRTERATWMLRVGSVNRKVIVTGRVAVNEARIAARCAVRGFGIAFLPRAPCAAYITDGKLIRVLPRVSGGEMSLWLVYPNKQLTAAARALADFLANKLPLDLSHYSPRD